MASTRGKSTPGRREKRFRRCSVAGCKTGQSADTAGKISIFGLPKNAERRQAWALILQRHVQQLVDSTQVCELHFDPGCVQRHYVHIIDGKEVRIPRDKPTLTADAVPTIFQPPKEPSEPTKTPQTTDEERSDLADDDNNHADIVIFSDQLAGEETVASETDAEASETSRRSATPRSTGKLFDQKMLLQLQTPAECWSCLNFPNFKGAVYVSSWFNDLSSEVITEKTVVFRPQRYPDVNCQVYIGRTLVQERQVTTVEEAEESLAGADELELCKGAASHAEWKEFRSLFTNNVRNSLVPGRPGSGAFFSKECSTTISKPHTVCTECKYIRRNLQTRKSKLGKRKKKEYSDYFPAFEVITVDESVYKWVSTQEAAKD